MKVASPIGLLSSVLLLSVGGGCSSGGGASEFPSGLEGASSGTISTGQGTITAGAGGGSSSSSHSTTTIMPTGTGTGSGSTGAGGSTIEADAACGESVEVVDQIPVDVFIMEDKSGSMNCPAANDACTDPPNPVVHPTRWEAFTNAVNGFVAAPSSTGIAVGIGYFPLSGNDNCNVAAYARPAVAIAPLPGNSKPISASIAANAPNGGTPTVPALTGAIDYAKAYTMATPGRTAAVLLVTDGVPNGCSSTVNAAAMIAQQAYGATPQIKTYVVGLGNTAALDQIALAGSGGATHYFPATGDVAGQLTAALQTITGMFTCKYTIPQVAGHPVDPSKVNVRITMGSGGTQQDIGKVDNQAACTSVGGWFYDQNPPASPTQILLCNQTCDGLKAVSGSGVKVLYGCPNRVPPPPR